jgi:hypothetical protein
VLDELRDRQLSIAQRLDRLYDRMIAISRA